jgi:hypothetical protein
LIIEIQYFRNDTQQRKGIKTRYFYNLIILDYLKLFLLINKLETVRICRNGGKLQGTADVSVLVDRFRHHPAYISHRWLPNTPPGVSPSQIDMQSGPGALHSTKSATRQQTAKEQRSD